MPSYRFESDDSDAFSQHKLHAKALSLLAKRAHSHVEIITKLKQKGFPDQAIEYECTQLLASNLLNDAQFAIDYTRYRAMRGFGPILITAELRAKGVNEQDITDALANDQINWQECRNRLLAKKRASLIACQPDERERKQQQFLYYRGFIDETGKDYN